MYYGYKESEWEKRNREAKKCVYMPKEMQDRLAVLQKVMEKKGIEVSYSSLLRRAFEISFNELEIQCNTITLNELSEGKCKW